MNISTVPTDPNTPGQSSNRALALARHYQVDRQMVYTIAAYHDVGLEKGREMHHIHSGKSRCGCETAAVVFPAADRRHA